MTTPGQQVSEQNAKQADLLRQIVLELRHIKNRLAITLGKEV